MDICHAGEVVDEGDAVEGRAGQEPDMQAIDRDDCTGTDIPAAVRESSQPAPSRVVAAEPDGGVATAQSDRDTPTYDTDASSHRWCSPAPLQPSRQCALRLLLCPIVPICV